MKDFWILFRLEMGELFPSQRKKHRADLFGSIVSFLLTLFVLGIFGFLFYAIAENYVGIRIDKISDPAARAHEFLTLLYALILVVSAWLSLVRMSRTLVRFSGREIFLRLPVSSSVVFSSKLTALLLSHYISTVPLIFVVNLIVYLALDISALFWLTTALVIIFLPLISFVLAALLLVPFIYIVDFVSKRYIAVFVSLCSALAIAFMLYAGLLSVVQEMFTLGSIKFLFNEDFITFMQTVARVSYPVNLLADLTLCENVVPAILISIGIVAIGGVLVYFITHTLYKITLYKNKPVPNAPRRRPKSRALSPFVSLLKKEFLLVYREPRFVFSFYAFALSMPVMVYSCFTLFRTLIDNALGLRVDFALSLFILLIFCILTNTFCATNISREGLGALRNKLLPIPARRILFAKAAFCMSVATLSVLASALVLVIFADVALLDGIVLWLFGSLFSLSHILIATRMDLNCASLGAESQASEESANHTMAKTVLIGLLFSFMIGTSSVLLLIFGTGGVVALSVGAYLFPALIALVYFGVALFYYLYRLEDSFNRMVA